MTVVNDTCDMFAELLFPAVTVYTDFDLYAQVTLAGQAVIQPYDCCSGRRQGQVTLTPADFQAFWRVP